MSKVAAFAPALGFRLLGILFSLSTLDFFNLTLIKSFAEILFTPVEEFS
jgi:hypothetical protein